jgi:hypothetical protein
LLPRGRSRSDEHHHLRHPASYLLAAAGRWASKLTHLGIGSSATVDADGIGLAQTCGLPVGIAGGEPVSMTEAQPLSRRDLPSVVLIKRMAGEARSTPRITVACVADRPCSASTRGYLRPQEGAAPPTGSANWMKHCAHLAARTGKTAEDATPSAQERRVVWDLPCSRSSALALQDRNRHRSHAPARRLVRNRPVHHRRAGSRFAKPVRRSADQRGKALPGTKRAMRRSCGVVRLKLARLREEELGLKFSVGPSARMDFADAMRSPTELLAHLGGENVMALFRSRNGVPRSSSGPFRNLFCHRHYTCRSIQKADEGRFLRIDTKWPCENCSVFSGSPLPTGTQGGRGRG